MLAPKYSRHPTKRDRGISLSRSSSQQKIYQSTHAHMGHQLNQSFECHEQKSLLFINESQEKVRNDKENRLSVIGFDSQSSRQERPRIGLSHCRNRSALQESSMHNVVKEQSFYLGDMTAHEAESIGQMISLLEEYEKNCQQQMDLESAEEARKRISQLKVQFIETRKKELEVQGKSHAMKTRREGQNLKKEFYQFWNNKVLEARQALQEIQHKHLEEQKRELADYETCVRSEQQPTVKYSSKVLEIRRNLTSLIKARNYKQAENLKEILAKREAQEQAKWTSAFIEKQAHKIEQFRKKQSVELAAFRLKLNSCFNELLKEKDKQQERMLKKMRKSEVEAGKVPAALVKARQQLLNQSKASIDRQHL